MKDRNLSRVLDLMAAWVLFVAVVGAICVGFLYAKKEEPPRRIVIEYKALNSQQDSSIKICVNSSVKLDSLIKEVKHLTNDIQSKRIEDGTKEIDKNAVDKLYSVIVAVILVIAGFFGFKNIAEIKQMVEKDARRISEETAREIAQKSSKEHFESIFTTAYKAEIFQQATESFNRQLDEEIAEMEQRIIDLHDRIDRLLIIQNGHQGNVQYDREQNLDNEIDEPLNPFNNA